MKTMYTTGGKRKDSVNNDNDHVSVPLIYRHSFFCSVFEKYDSH